MPGTQENAPTQQQIIEAMKQIAATGGADVVPSTATKTTQQLLDAVAPFASSAGIGNSETSGSGTASGN